MQHRLGPSPAAILAVLALFFALGGSALAVGRGVFASSAVKPQARCQNGAIRGIAIVVGFAGKGIQNLPPDYTGDPQAFTRRFNCAGGGVQVRHSHTGNYDVQFPGITGASCLASGLSPNAGSASCQLQPDGSFHVIVRSAATSGNVLDPSDIPFLVVVF